MTTTPTRNTFGITVAAVFLVFAAGLTTAALTLGGWWHLSWIAVAFFALFGAVGLALDATKRHRDDKGHAIRNRKGRP